ncbi:MAG TPA: hypothetical protein VGC30_05480 [Dokdonella sp.]
MTYHASNGGGSALCVWVSNNGATPTLFDCGTPSAQWDYVPAGGTTKFILAGGGSASATPVISTFTVTGVAGTQPYIHASPSTVTVPYGSASADTTVTWSAPGYSALDWWTSTNGGAWQWGLNSQASGTTALPINPGQTVAIRLYPYSSTHAGEGGTANVLASVVINGVQGAQPHVTATPNPVVVPYGSTSANTSVAWSAPGYSALDWWVSINGSAWQWSFNSQPTYTTTLPINPGETVSMRAYPYSATHAGEGGSANIVMSINITGVEGAQPTFSADPAHVIVPVGATTGSTTIHYNAPGYSGLDWWLSTNGGPFQWAVNGPASGASQLSPLNVGSTYQIRFYPYSSDISHPGEGGAANVLGQVTITVSH